MGSRNSCSEKSNSPSRIGAVVETLASFEEVVEEEEDCGEGEVFPILPSLPHQLVLGMRLASEVALLCFAVLSLSRTFDDCTSLSFFLLLSRFLHRLLVTSAQFQFASVEVQLLVLPLDELVPKQERTGYINLTACICVVSHVIRS
jgi:hypothetical protein